MTRSGTTRRTVAGLRIPSRHLGAALLAAVLVGSLPALAREPARRPAADALEPCPEQGAGFVRQKGSRTCFRLSGRVGAGLDVRAGADTRAAPSAAGRFAIDTRTESDIGPVRAFVRMGHGRP
ncbi:porin [Methylobacterium durans]|uniref:porin n=1 Tax=Methylobacterium durans TaxID=2202825 RepID=UPI001F3CE742|nr:porin [Methylobacterium durans]